MRRILPWILLSCALAQDPSQALEHARTVNLERAATLPNFVADEIATRYKSRHTNPPQWQYVDTIESEISVKGAEFTRQNIRLNGKPWTKNSFPSFNWSVQFCSELKPLFSSECNTAIQFEQREERNGRPVLAYRFQTPPGCFGGFVIQFGLLGLGRTKRYKPAWTGRFLVEDPGGSVVEFENEAHEFPKGFGADPLQQTFHWDYVKIGDATHLLPIGAEIFGGFTQADLWHVVVEYKNHRHFESSTNITFQ